MLVLQSYPKLEHWIMRFKTFHCLSHHCIFIEDNTWACIDMGYDDDDDDDVRLEHHHCIFIDIKLNMRRDIPYLQATMYYFVYYIDILITTFFRRFSTTFRRFSKNCLKATRTLPDNCQRLSKISEDVSIIHQKI